MQDREARITHLRNMTAWTIAGLLVLCLLVIGLGSAVVYAALGSGVPAELDVQKAYLGLSGGVFSLSSGIPALEVFKRVQRLQIFQMMLRECRACSGRDCEYCRGRMKWVDGLLLKFLEACVTQ
jgi:hypothetical protein